MGIRGSLQFVGKVGYLLLVASIGWSCSSAPTTPVGPVPATETPPQVPTATPTAGEPVGPSFLPSDLALIEPGNAATIQRVAEIPVPESARVYFVDFSPDGRMLAGWSQDLSDRNWSVEIWDVSSGERMARSQDWEGPRQVLSSPSGNFLAAIMFPGRPITIWNAGGVDKLSLMSGDDIFVAFSPDYTYLVSFSYDDGTDQSLVAIIDTQSGQVVHEIEADGFLTGVAFSPGNRTVSIGSGGGVEAIETTLWDVIDGERLQVLPGIDKLTFSSDDRHAAGMRDIGTWISVFRTDNWEEQFRLGEGTGTVHDEPAFTPDGRILAALSKHQVSLWDVTSGEVLVNIGSPDKGAIIGFALSPDGTLMATCDDLAVGLWGVVP